MQRSGLIQAPAALRLGKVSPVLIYMTGLASQPVRKNSENRTFLYFVATIPACVSPRGDSVQLADVTRTPLSQETRIVIHIFSYSF